MKFYDREEEQELLENIREASLQESQMTVLFGRRRIGKTQLALQCTAGNLTLYFFVARKAETLLCQDFVEEAENKLGLPIGSYVSFTKLFRLVRWTFTELFLITLREIRWRRETDFISNFRNRHF